MARWNSPAQVCAACSAAGVAKGGQSARSMVLKGTLAGMIIALGAMAASTAAFSMGSPSALRLASGLIFPFGLGIVILTGCELYTGNILMLIPVFSGELGVGRLFRNLGLVLLGNALGGVLAAAACVWGGQMTFGDGELGLFLLRLAVLKCSLAPGQAVVLGILCNVLVCAGVLLAMCAEDVPGKILGAYIPVALFVICGFEHCVANLFYIPAALFALEDPGAVQAAAAAGIDLSPLTWGRFLLGNMLPVTVGNFLGGGLLAGYLWLCYGKVSAKKAKAGR